MCQVPVALDAQFKLITNNNHRSRKAKMPSASASSNNGLPIGVTPPTSSSSPGASDSSSTMPPVSGPGPTSSGPGGPPTNGPGQPCCESGRPVMTDPITGQTVCSCQYDNHILNYQRLAASGGLPLGMYNPAAASAYSQAVAEGGFLPGLSSEQMQSAFYPPGVSTRFSLLSLIRSVHCVTASIPSAREKYMLVRRARVI